MSAQRLNAVRRRASSGSRRRTILITGSCGLIGSEASLYFAAKGCTIVGVDNDMRARFFGADASTRWNRRRLERSLGRGYEHHSVDVRRLAKLEDIFKRHAKSLKAVIHTAAQPSHDWAARDPFTDFTVNANATLNMLELARRYCPESPFVFTSTNKVYGDAPNALPLVEREHRWEVAEGHPYARKGIDETMSIDHSKHSLFGASKAAADLMTQEFGRYFDMPTVCFRGGCLSGPAHSGTQLHGFLSYLMKCVMTGTTYNVLGYGGKQVRDNIHSYDLVRMFDAFIESPRAGEVYNAGGSRHSNCSILEAARLCGEIANRKPRLAYVDTNRIGDHIWYISDVSRFQSHYPGWKYTADVRTILTEIFEFNKDRWK